MLVGRGTIAAHNWGLRVDQIGQPYLQTEKGRSYMVEAGGEYDAQQAEYSRRALEGKEPPPAPSRSSEEEDSPGGPLALLFLEEPQGSSSTISITKTGKTHIAGTWP